MKYSFRISDFSFSLDCPDAVAPPENFLKFRSTSSEAEYRYTLVLSDELPPPAGTLAARRDDILIYWDGDRETRYLRIHGASTQDAYACCRELSSNSTQIFLRSFILGDLIYDTIFTSLFSLERRLIGRDALILHSSYNRYKGEAILFSAPSGTGKSTQAGLWERYRGAKQINGDRSLLRKIDGVWTACGWPVCGSSEICHNVDTPIRAIVMLSQAPENRIERLGAMAAFSRLYSQITINRWDRAFTMHAMDLIDALVKEVPIYHLACTISEEAVNCLDEALNAKL